MCCGLEIDMELTDDMDLSEPWAESVEHEESLSLSTIYIKFSLLLLYGLLRRVLLVGDDVKVFIVVCCC